MENDRNETSQKDLKRDLSATDDTEREKALADFEPEWGQKYPSNRSKLATGGARSHPVLRLPTSSAQNHYRQMRLKA